jgi:hypothetical protein
VRLPVTKDELDVLSERISRGTYFSVSDFQRSQLSGGAEASAQ